eukprot:639003-Ditylum_brightwellii.AAC.1
MFVHATTLERAKYHLKTALGISDDSTLCDMFDEFAHGATFVSPDQVHQVLLTILRFVDDANNQVNEFVNNK